jgi:hypothetical protein
MGTWNPGPFDNDAAADLLDLVADEEPDLRGELIRDMLNDGLRLAAGEEVYLFPKDVVAAATLVAISVPGALGRLTVEDEEVRFVNSLLPDVGHPLALLAVEALHAMAVPGNDWYDTWFDRDVPVPEAAEPYRIAVEVLQGFIEMRPHRQPRSSAQDLVGVLNRELGDISLRFTVGVGSLSPTGAALTLGEISVGVFGSGESYLLSFHWKGRHQANGEASDPFSVADSARLWVEGSGLENLAATHPFVEFSALQLSYEHGTAVEFQWAALLELVENGWASFRDLVTAASENLLLRQFFPHLGHRFALSADEFSSEILVAVFVHHPGWFVVFDGGGETFAFEGPVASLIVV